MAGATLVVQWAMVIRVHTRKQWFFERWLCQQEDDVLALVARLVASGIFANGW